MNFHLSEDLRVAFIFTRLNNNNNNNNSNKNNNNICNNANSDNNNKNYKNINNIFNDNNNNNNITGADTGFQPGGARFLGTKNLKIGTKRLKIKEQKIMKKKLTPVVPQLDVLFFCLKTNYFILCLRNGTKNSTLNIKGNLFIA